MENNLSFLIYQYENRRQEYLRERNWHVMPEAVNPGYLPEPISSNPKEWKVYSSLLVENTQLQT